MLDKLNVVDFQPYLNQTFSIHFAPEVTLPAELISVVAWGSETEKYRQPFTLEFRTAQKNEYYQQGTFIVLHPSVGELPIFLVPIGADAEGMRYEAVFT